MKTVLILGARGRFGDACVQAFARAGWRVHAHVRPTGAAADAPVPLPPGVTRLAHPLADTERLARAAPGASLVVHAVNPPYTDWPRQAMPALRQAMAVARRLDARLLLPGNVYVYGRSLPAVLDEDTPFAADTPHGRIRVAMEAALRADTRLRSTVLRAGDFYGHGRGTWLDLLIAKRLAEGRLVYPGPLDRPHAWAYLPDLADTVVALAERRVDGPVSERLHFAGQSPTGAELLQALQQAAARLGMAPADGWRIAGFPWPLLRAAGLVWPMGRALARMSYLWRAPHALDGGCLAAALGAAPSARLLSDALARTLADLHPSAQPAPSRPDGHAAIETAPPAARTTAPSNR